MSFLQKLVSGRGLKQCKFLLFALLFTTFYHSGYGQCDEVQAYTGTSSEGNQTYGERLGLVFTNSQPISISSLGAYDDDQDGLNLPITVGIVRNSDGATVVGPIVLSGFGSPLNGMYRINSITPVILPSDEYTIVAVGYGVGERNGNSNLGGHPTVNTNGGGIVSFNNASFGGVGFGLPTTFFATPGAFHAGTFEFEAVPPSNAFRPAGTNVTTPFVATIDFDDDHETCINSILHYGVLTNIDTFHTISWAVSAGGTILQGQNSRNVQVQWTATSVQSLSFVLTNTESGCTVNNNIFVTVNPNPTVSIIPEDFLENICPRSNFPLEGVGVGGELPYTYSWNDFGSNTLIATDIPNPIFNSSVVGSYVIELTITDNNGCSGSASIDLEVGDDEAPVVTCPSDVTIETELDVCNAQYFYEVTFTDNCKGLDIMGFVDEFAPSEWTLSNDNGGNGSADETGAPSSITIIGSDFGPVFGAANYTNYCVGISGTSPGFLSFSWNYETFDGDGAFYDRFGYLVDGVFTQLTSNVGGTIQNGNTTIMLSPGQNFCFSIYSVDQGFGAAVTIAMNFTYMEQTNPILTQTTGIASGEDFPFGTTVNTFEVEDLGGNVVECSFTVTVIDKQSPNIVCPSDVTVQLDPTECEGEAFFDDAIATDNCTADGDILFASDFASGDIFDIGIHQVTFIATDESGNSATCSISVTILDYVNPNLGCIKVNLSLDEVCSATLDPTMFLTGWATNVPGEVLLGCFDDFIITIKKPDGSIVPLSDLRLYLGKTLEYSVTHNFQSFSCWNTVLIEDKYPPTIDCRDITVSCLANTDNLVVAFASDNCNAVTQLVGEVHNVLTCDPNIIGTITRRYIAVDDFGNQSADTCTAVISLERSNFAAITPPADNVKISCSENYARDNKGFGYPAPSRTGVPTFNGVPVFPTSQLNMLFCNAIIDYTDVLLVDIPCKTRIRRTWRVIEWWCSQTVERFIAVQLIEILDETAPVIPAVADMTVTTQTRSCEALVALPVLNITDNCNTIKSVYINVTTDGLPSGYLGSNGGNLEFAVGEHEVTYTAFDRCDNSSSRSFTVTVRDQTQPIPICDQFTTVSIKTNGYTEVTASAVDDGSFDECGAVTLQIQRMEDPCGTNYHIGWHDKVGFCCADANRTRMVTLLVTDKGGNSNQCMVSVNVQEKVNPSIVCPADITISDCTYTFDDNNLDFYFGAAEIIDNCPANNDLIESYIDGRNTCGVGNLVRTFSVESGGTVFGTCTQTITFQNNEPFDGNNPSHLTWPSDYTAVGACSLIGVEPEMLPVGSRFPIISQDVCDRVGFTKVDQVFPFDQSGACFKVLRHWTVIDWCQTNSDGTYKTWTHEQEIKIMDNEAPVITSPDTTRITLTYDVECASGYIELTASATDCTPSNELGWTYRIYKDGLLYRSGLGNNASGNYPIGFYQVEFTVIDRCGNLNITGYDFEIINAKPPGAVCIQGLSTDLVPMDLSGDGVADTAMVEIHVSQFNNKSSHVCYPNDIVLLSFSPDVNDTTKIFGCGQIGVQPISMYVTGRNGNQNFCTTTILVTNNNPLYTCAPGLIEKVLVSGKISNEQGEEIESVMVSLKGTEKDDQETGEDGKYQFSGVDKGGNYQVIPTKDGDYKNGVSTLDLVLIQRHVLGIEYLDSPYKLIAADVNNNGGINTSDLIHLRKLILGIDMSFTSNTSWRFVEGNHLFIDPTNPWATPLTEKCEMNGVDKDMVADFVGIKIGDVNLSAEYHNFGNKNTESRSISTFEVADRMVTKGEIVKLEVKSRNLGTVYGWQQIINNRGLELVKVESGKIDIQESDFVSIEANKTGFSVAIAQGEVINVGDHLFTLVFRAEEDGRLSEMIDVDKSLSSEIYIDGLKNENTLRWSWNTAQETSFELISQHPNPWVDQMEIRFSIPQEGMVKLKIKDATGRSIITEAHHFVNGTHSIVLNRDQILTSGVYFYELRYQNEVKTGKCVVID